MTEFKNAQIAEFTMEVAIEASVDSVWTALTDDIGTWWPAEFFAGGEPDNRTYHLEARPGGRMYEQWADGGGLVWATVVTVQPGAKLQAVGSTFPEWGGPSTMLSTWELTAGEGEGQTKLRFSESTIGVVSEANLEDKEKGWRFLFERALKAHAEGRPAPVWED